MKGKQSTARILALWTLVFALIAAAAIGYAHANAEPSAGDSVVSGANAAGAPAGRVSYVDGGVHTMPNTTPVPSDSQCNQWGDLHKIEIRLVGTMAGTNPQVSLQPRNSVDGSTWTNVGSAVVINATTTPAVSTFTFSDHTGQPVFNSTAAAIQTSVPNAYGDCWDILQTWSGTGTVTANYSIKGVDKNAP